MHSQPTAYWMCVGGAVVSSTLLTRRGPVQRSWVNKAAILDSGLLTDFYWEFPDKVSQTLMRHTCLASQPITLSLLKPGHDFIMLPDDFVPILCEPSCFHLLPQCRDQSASCLYPSVFWVGFCVCVFFFFFFFCLRIKTSNLFLPMVSCIYWSKPQP